MLMESLPIKMCSNRAIKRSGNCAPPKTLAVSDNTDVSFDLFDALSLLESGDEAKRFIVDLCTPSEISEFIERWKVCQLLNRRTYSYRQIKEITGASLTTIGRVARFLNDEHNEGYKLMLDKISKRIIKK
jgi:TrpR-related protein YerC/YecD